jgi:hypothetical protein
MNSQCRENLEPDAATICDVTLTVALLIAKFSCCDWAQPGIASEGGIVRYVTIYQKIRRPVPQDRRGSNLLHTALISVVSTL